jgi:hypothetical protein
MRYCLLVPALLVLVATANATPIVVWYNDFSTLDGVHTYAPLGAPYLANGGVMADIGPDDTGYFSFFVYFDEGAADPQQGVAIHNEGEGEIEIALRWDPDPDDPNWYPETPITFWLRLYSSKPDPNNPTDWVFSGAQNYDFLVEPAIGWNYYVYDINDWKETDFWGPFDPDHVYGFQLDYVVWTSDYHPCSIGLDETRFLVPECPRDLTGDDMVTLADLAELLGAYGCDESAEQTAYDTAGFEGFDLGDLNGQDGWEAIYGAGLHQIINDPTGGGHGQVLELDAAATDDLIAVQWLLDTPVTKNEVSLVIYEWDQYRPDLGDNIWVCDDYAYDGWWAVEWDSGTPPDVSPGPQFGGGVPLTAGVWQHIRFDLNLSAKTSSVSVDGGVPVSMNHNFDDIKGIELECQGTDVAGDGPIYFDNVVVKFHDHCPIDYFDDGKTNLNDLAHLLGTYGCGVP